MKKILLYSLLGLGLGATYSALADNLTVPFTCGQYTDGGTGVTIVPRSTFDNGGTLCNFGPLTVGVFTGVALGSFDAGSPYYGDAGLEASGLFPTQVLPGSCMSFTWPGSVIAWCESCDSTVLSATCANGSGVAQSFADGGYTEYLAGP